MTIINLEGDGIYPQLIVLFRAVAYLGKVEIDELKSICYPGAITDKSVSDRFRGVLSNWIDLGLFVENNKQIELHPKFVKNRGESIDSFTDRLPSFCRQLIFEPQNCIPLWPEGGGLTEEGVGRTADFVRGMAWALAQDIYNFPTVSAKAILDLDLEQRTAGKFIFLNETRPHGLRFWARYLGFATGEGAFFQIDPTLAIRGELASIFGARKELSASDFLNSLCVNLPVLDFGRYRQEVESHLNQTAWRKPAGGHISMSLSLALRRLDLDNIIKLEGKADTGSSFRLTGKNYRTWMGFESVILNRGRL